MEAQETNFLNEKLYLPLFMVSRIPLKENQNHGSIKSYIAAKKHHYLSTWDEEIVKQYDSYALRKSRHILGKDDAKSSSRCEQPQKVSTPSNANEKPWQLAPNRYGLETRPFASKSGLKGAYWPKGHTTKPRKIFDKKPVYRLYDLPRETEKMDTNCHKHKSQFLSNARERRPSTRGMIANPLTTFRNPNEPGPCTYTPKEQGKTYEIVKPSRHLHPHVFYRKSVVPLKKNSIHPTNISFRPGPGRYETRYCNICPCSNNRKYQPELDLIAERQKRFKFRRLPYTKIQPHLYCSPDWRHVRGSGFPHLFKGAKPTITSIKDSDEGKDKSKQVKLFHDAKYINMICYPTHDLGSVRTEPMPQLPTRIKFDRMIRVISRKQLRSNRKLAFGSSAERWKDDERPVVLTSQQIRELKEKLPPERRMRDYPVMLKNSDEIESKLFETPAHMLPNYIPKLRKRLFKFLPLPKAKILISDEDIRPKEPAKHGYFFRPLDEKSFFKEKKN